MDKEEFWKDIGRPYERKGMKILFVHPCVSMSVGDVARGYHTALTRAGHELVDYQLDARLAYHRKALPQGFDNDQTTSRFASETILNEALYNEVDLVLIICGLNVHPIALWLLGRLNIKVAVILTESPYEDEQQATWADLSHVGATVDLTVFTNDRYSAQKYEWHFLPPSYDPEIHKPSEIISGQECDVLMVGTGWPERQALLEQVNWEGINLRLFGLWPEIKDDSPLVPFYHQMFIKNEFISPLYCGAKINLNIHRQSAVALTPNPRVFEVAGCGAFQLSDYREDMGEMFGGNIPAFSSANELEEKIRYFLARPEERKSLAAGALDYVCNQDFDERVKEFERVMDFQIVSV